jgi:hypothetical protein
MSINKGLAHPNRLDFQKSVLVSPNYVTEIAAFVRNQASEMARIVRKIDDVWSVFIFCLRWRMGRVKPYSVIADLCSSE